MELNKAQKGKGEKNRRKKQRNSNEVQRFKTIVKNQGLKRGRNSKPCWNDKQKELYGREKSDRKETSSTRGDSKTANKEAYPGIRK